MSGKNIVIEELEAMRQRMEDLYVRNFKPEGSQTDADAGPGTQEWMPAADIIDSEKELTYLLDLPGVLDKDLQVECRADRLWVHGIRREDVPAGESLEIERPRGGFSRVFKLPCFIKEDAIRAELKKGVLRIVVPKECSTNERPQKVIVRQED